jgi:Phage capsid protein
MSENLPKMFVETFSTNLMLKLQQTQSMLRGLVMEGQHHGQQASPVDYIGDVQAKTPLGKFAPLQMQNPDFSRRWVTPVDKDIGPTPIDSFDKLKLAMDPTSRYSEVHAAAVAREWDDRIIQSAFAVATIGSTTGLTTTTETFSTANWQIASNFKASAATGLTVAKMIEAKRIMRKAQVPVDTETLTWITNSQGESDLLNQVQVVSTEFNGGRPTLVDGKVVSFMGWGIRYSERLTSTSNVRQNMAFVKSGLYLGIWKDMETLVSRREDLSGAPYQIYNMMSSGATRLEPGRLLQVLCADTSAASDVTP